MSSPRTTGFLIVLDTARIADSPGLMIAVKFSTSSMPMFEMVKVDPLISSGARPPARALSMSCFERSLSSAIVISSASRTTGTTNP